MKIIPHILSAFYWIMLACLQLSLSGCVTIPPPHGDLSDPRALDILEQAAAAHGSPALSGLHDVNVHFAGHWDWLVARVQPVLVDADFRGISNEQYLINDESVEQCYTGIGGCKRVFHDKTLTRVWYNNQESTDPDVRDAAALVADNYRMFLLGPRFFQERRPLLQYLGVEDVEGMTCDNLLAVLTPGIGNSRQDRVVISIDREKHWLRRLRITVDGLGSTRGAVADIFLRDHIRIGGIVWPTSFYEELKRPFDSPVHQWRMTGIDLHNSP